MRREPGDVARTVSDLIAVSDRVRAALDAGRGVVALETSVLAQGLPHPHNVEAMESMTEAVSTAGAEPAWIAVLDGRVRVGLEAQALIDLAGSSVIRKVARRDLPAVVAGGGPGATTVSATIWAANSAGIEVMATGGIGGVHITTGDVSADLLELARTPCTVVCSGPKSIVDPRATMERLEELGVAVLGYRCDRLPFFLVTETDIPIEHRADSPSAVAEAALARRRLGIESALLLCNPVPSSDALPRATVDAAVAECISQAKREGVAGKAVTPYLLNCLAERTGGKSLIANLALLRSNAALAAEIAVALAR